MLTRLQYGNTNTYLIRGSAGILLVDTDWAGTLPAFYKAIKAQNLQVSDISCVLATHYHPDHMGIAADLMTLGVPLVLFDVQLSYVHFSDGIYAKEKNRFYRPIDESLARILSCSGSREFLCSLGIAGEVIHTPGHSADSISLLLDEGVAVVGDLLPYSALSAMEEETVRNSYREILSHGVTELHYGHMVCERV